MKQLFILFLFCAGLFGFVQLREPRTIEKIVKVEVTKPERSVKELVNEIAPKYGISPIVLGAIIERESGNRKDAIRFEPSQMARARKLSKDPEQQRMLASSHGTMQVMGWWAPHFNLSWADLYEPETNIEVASSILKDCLDRHKSKSKVEQLRSGLECYNGSPQYADAVMSRLGNLLIERAI